MKDLPLPVTAADRTARRGLWTATIAIASLIVAGAFTAPERVAPACLALAIFASIVTIAQAKLAGFHSASRFGPANVVTLIRAAGAAVIGAIGLSDPAPSDAAAWAITWAAAGLLALDGIDGWLARRSGLASAFGARFDMEVDALTALVLAILVWNMDKTGSFVLGLGLMRYAFVCLGRALPAFAAPLRPSWRRKVICVVQLATLTALVAPAVVPPVSTVLAAATLTLVGWSFARDIRWLATR